MREGAVRKKEMRCTFLKGNGEVLCSFYSQFRVSPFLATFKFAEQQTTTSNALLFRPILPPACTWSSFAPLCNMMAYHRQFLLLRNEEPFG